MKSFLLGFFLFTALSQVAPAQPGGHAEALESITLMQSELAGIMGEESKEQMHAAAALVPKFRALIEPLRGSGSFVRQGAEEAVELLDVIETYAAEDEESNVWYGINFLHETFGEMRMKLAKMIPAH